MSSTKRASIGDADPLTGCGLLAGETIPTIRQAPPKLQALNWRDHLAVHPAAELFPLLSETDPAALKELAEDIKQHGQREPASYIKDSGGNRVLLDGRNRLDALEMLGRKIDVNDSRMFEQLSGGINAQAFIISKNIHRRHLSGEDKRDLIAKLLKEKPETPNRQIAKQIKADHKTVGSIRSEMEGRGEIPHVSARIDTKGRKQPAKKQTQPEKSTSSDSSRSEVSQVSTTPEKCAGGLPTGSDSPKTPIEQSSVVETQTQPNPIIAAWDASTLAQREEFIEDLGDFITEWSITIKAREKDAELRYHIWQSCFGIDTGIDDADKESGRWRAEYELLADQLSDLERTIDAAPLTKDELPPDDGLGIPDYLKRVAP
jgi:hypothetical protein